MSLVRCLWVFGLLLGLTVWFSAQAGDAVRERLQEFSVLRGEFSQEKHLQGFRNPLRSSGRFLLARSRGVIWETQKPFPSTLILNAKGLTELGEQGDRRALLDAEESPAVTMLNALLPALISGDLDVLAASFDVNETVTSGQGWKLHLIPRPGPMQQVFESISLQGEAFVNEVELRERNGDSSVLMFSALQSSVTELDADEARRFD